VSRGGDRGDADSRREVDMDRKSIRSLTFFSEEFPDGFRDEEPTWFAYCPDACEKRTLPQHRECPYFGGTERDEEGVEIAFRCAHPVR
jgi:hypothetical protein